VAYRQNNGGGGGEYASQGSQPLHFGLGRATTATVVVNWPSGVVDTLPGVPVDQIITVTEGSNPQ
jgi:enediyne biosynthesis protein E4